MPIASSVIDDGSHRTDDRTAAFKLGVAWVMLWMTLAVHVQMKP